MADWGWVNDLGATPGAVGGIVGGIAALVVAFITGWFSARTHHKLPHERLQILVEIAKEIPDDVDRDQVLRRQMSEELAALGRYSPPEHVSLWLVWIGNVVIALLILLAFNSVVSWWFPVAGLVVGAGLLLYYAMADR
ncbi:hypothetical protein [Nocardia lijiangensis]|uniref:hypothetical protein n=1 Tax=Nocardia lijiangensis TaxID=299618 RepID=UPI0008358A97|nr:hypothetical protein [Nocardia lijiangensis]